MSSIEEKNLIIDKNLKENERMLVNNLEKRIAHISEKAEMVMGGDMDEVRTVYENVFTVKSQINNCLPVNERYIFAVQSVISLFDKINCVENHCPNNVMKIFDVDSDVSFESDTIVYLKNPLADIAYNNFSKLLKDARVSYEESFDDVCEEVYYSRAPYCILPVENSEEGRLSGFGRLIRKYELKIILTCNVESANGKTTRFALLKRELAVVKCSSNIIEGEYLEIGFNFGESQRLHEVLQAANFFGYRLNKVDSLPIYYSEKEYYFDVVFKGKGELERFLFWLELEVPRYEIIGVYTHIKTLRGRSGGNND